MTHFEEWESLLAKCGVDSFHDLEGNLIAVFIDDARNNSIEIRFNADGTFDGIFGWGD